MSLAENLKQRRLQKQLTQPALAEKAEVSKGYIYMLESGEMTNPTLDILIKIADALDCTIADFAQKISLKASCALLAKSSAPVISFLKTT